MHLNMLFLKFSFLFQQITEGIELHCFAEEAKEMLERALCMCVCWIHLALG